AGADGGLTVSGMRWRQSSRHVSGAQGRAPSGGRIVRLLAEIEAPDERAVALDVGALQVVELPAALADELQEAAARGVVLLVRLEVLGEVRDPLAEERDLHLGRAGVALVRRVLLDDGGLLEGVEHGNDLGPASRRAAERDLAGLTPGREEEPEAAPARWPGHS